MNTDAVPVYDPNAPGATYDDAVAIHDSARAGPTRLPTLLRAKARSQRTQFVTDLGAIVDAGPAAFDDAAIGTLLTRHRSGSSSCGPRGSATASSPRWDHRDRLPDGHDGPVRLRSGQLMLTETDAFAFAVNVQVLVF